MYTRKIEDFFPSPVKIPTYIILLIGIYVLFQNYIVGLLIIFFCLLVVTAHEGISIDQEKKRMKIFWSVLFIRVGNWEPLPKIGRILLVPEKTKYKGFSLSARTTEYSVKRFGVRLYYPDSNDYILAAKNKLDKAKHNAEILSNIFDKKYEDYSDVKIEEFSKK